MLPVFLVLAACGGDTTGPQGSSVDLPESGIYGWRPRESSPVAVRVNPNSVTVETNQLIRFQARGQNRAGDDIAAPVSWSTTGGTILPDGRFSAAAIGTYQVIGRTRTSADAFVVDTSMVTVVRRRTGLVSLKLSPDSVTLAPRVSQSFAAVGYQLSGVPVVIGVVWKATGGAIDPAGTYVAGDTAGRYKVIATNTAGTLADTAIVIITAPPTLPPPSDSAPPTIPLTPPPPPPPPAPVLQSVLLVPATATLATGTNKQFSAYGRTTVGDSVAVEVVYSATGGTVTPGGLFTAGTQAGTFRVIAQAGVLSDTSSVVVSLPLGGSTGSGIGYGPFAAWDGITLKPYTEGFSLSFASVSPDVLLDRITIARAKRLKMLITMTGGHLPYLTDFGDGDGLKFDRVKWDAAMDQFNTPAIKTAVAEAVADGTIVGNSVMDEPHVHGIGDGNTWGPSGTMTKARVDSLCAYVRNIFPTLPVGVSHQHGVFEPAKSYKVCEFLIDQYSYRSGDVTQFRDDALAMGQRDRLGIVFSMNILNGGIQDPTGICPQPLTGGLGTQGINCRMTSQQVRDWGILLGSAGCALIMWRYDSAFMVDPGNQQAFADVGNRLASLPPKSCQRS
ncbi:MAG: hypothetical protein ACJ8BF_15320 [Gemmatimonadales bacterium]